MSAKFRLTLWLTLMVLLPAAAVLVFVILINKTSTLDDPAERLVRTVLSNAEEVSFEDGSFDLEDLDSYRRGVYCSYYAGDGTLLLSAMPEDVDPAGIPVEPNVLRTVRLTGGEYFLYDVRAEDDGHAVLVRGLVSTGDSSGLMHAITVITLTLLPIILLVALGGGWLIAWDTFRPMEKIVDAANSISDGDDLTARIELGRASSEMRRLGSAFNRMFGRLERSFHTERQFASDASHELRTPVTVVLAECDRARRKDRTPENYRESLAVIEEQSRHMSELVQQLLSLTRLQHGTDRYPLREGDLSGFAAACVGEFSPGDERGIRLETEIEPGIRASFNPALYSRLVMNLLQNAYQYGRPGGRIRLSLKKEEGRAVLRVEDDGIGIAPEDLDKVWQRFWQADPGREENGSTGLGLAMVKEIAELHGGRAAVESEPGKGSTFTVTI